MLTFLLNYLALAVLAAAYLVQRLPRDYHRAAYRVQARCMFMRHGQLIRNWQQDMVRQFPHQPVIWREAKKQPWSEN